MFSFSDIYGAPITKFSIDNYQYLNFVISTQYTCQIIITFINRCSLL